MNERFLFILLLVDNTNGGKRMENSLARELSGADVNVQYDAQVKKVLSEKIILAWILKSVTSEFTEMPIEKIEECIEDNPQISTVKVNPGETNEKKDSVRRIIGISTEDKVPEEGTIYYDIRFFAYTPETKNRIKIIVNLEAQKSFYPGYEVVTRGIFYGGRMISAQLDTEFEIPNYDGLKKVYSIWICMNAPLYIGNAISSYSINKQDFVRGIPDKKWAYDKLSVIMICLNEKEEKETEFLKMLNTLLSTTKNVEEKKQELEQEFQINMKSELGKELNLMCNLSELVEEQGIEKGAYNKIKELVEKKIKKGLSVEEIAEVLEESVETIQKVIMDL